MERLTMKRRLPQKGQFIEVSESELSQINDVPIEDIYRKLQVYEDTELTPKEVKILQEDNARLHKLLDNLEAVLTRKPPEHNSGNDNKVHCKDCDYLNMDSGKPFCCHPRMSTNGLDDWCNFGTKRQS